jgi:hypothetical protein
MIRIVRNPRNCVIFMLLAAAMTRILAQNVSDSASYFQLKEKIPQADSLQIVLETADALAGQGLYAEAMDMLLKLTHKEEPVKTPEKRHSPWRISTGVDYYHLQDVDTIAMTPDQLRDYQRLTQTPFTTYVRAAYEICPLFGMFEKATPQVYFSSYKGGGEIPLLMHMGNGRYTLEAALKADKWFQPTAADRDSFNIVKKQDSDRGGASLRFSQSAPFIHGKRWSLIAPVSLEWEHYRADRPGYESFAEGRLTPVLEIRYKEGSPLSTRMTGEARYEKYYRKVSDSLSAARFLARMENDFKSSSGLTMNLSAEWQGDRYADRHVPADIDRWEASLRSEYLAAKWLEPRMVLRGIHEKERYDRTDSVKAYSLPGIDLIVRPSIRLRMGGALVIEPEFDFRRRFAGLNPDTSTRRLIWEAYESWEPGLRVECSFPRMDISGRMSIRTEDVDEQFEQFIKDSRSIKVSGDGSILVIKGLSINFLVDYQFRRYDDNRKTENFSLSGQATYKW